VSIGCCVLYYCLGRNNLFLFVGIPPFYQREITVEDFKERLELIRWHTQEIMDEFFRVPRTNKDSEIRTMLGAILDRVMQIENELMVKNEQPI
jgi:hypothetical protein